MLVIEEVEALLLQFLLHAPVGFGEKDEARMSITKWRDDPTPVIYFRRLPCTPLPGARKYFVEQELCHIASNPIALARDIAQSRHHRCAYAGVKSVQL